MANTPLRFGILGCANIARAFVHDVAPSPQVQVVAVASRDARKAAAFAADFKLARHHGSYQALLDDPELDAIYLPLPNSLHAEWAIRAAQAGKHVLCEKPMALDRAEAQAMFDAAKREIRRFAPVTAGKRPAPVEPAASASRPPAPTVEAKAATTKPTGSRSARQRVVVVDAGHGGRDNGMSGPIGGGPRIYEKNVTLAVSKQLQRALEDRGIRVVMTRTTDTLIGLYDRGPIANAAKGDLFVSIHVNAANPRWQNPGGARGFETYFLAEAKTEDERRVAAMENEAVKFETNADVSRDDPLGFIMRDMAQNEHLRESMRLATLIQAGLRTVHPGPNRGVKQAGLAVLVTAFMPAVLVEIGFGTNRAEANYITNPQRQSELADRLADAVERYLDEYERKVGG